MTEFDLVIRGGTVATASDVFAADVGIANGLIVALGRDLGVARQEIDARGRLVLPGGVDTHCHIEEPPAGKVRNADTFSSATASAAAGGTTTVIPFCMQEKGGVITPSLRDYHRKAEQAMIDYSFHLIITDPSDAALAELPGLIEEGHRSLKIFLTYDNMVLDDAETLKVLALARRCGALVCIHAENHAAIAFLTEALERAGLTQPKYHAWAKPVAVEREACHRVISLAELVDTPIHIFHVSGVEPAEEIRRAQQRGLKVFAETCPQYLMLTADDLDKPGFEGAKFLCSPAPRTQADKEALWGFLRDGTLSVFSSDHAPNRFDDRHGKKVEGEDAPFSVVPNGVPGLETRLPILFSEGVSSGRIDLPNFVALSATNPARLFGLHPRKGAIAVGADADIAIWNPDRKVKIRNANLHHQVDYTVYEDVEVTGWPEITLSRGEIVCWEGEIVGHPGRGRFVPRAPYEHIAPTGRFVTPFDPVSGRTVKGS
ncbi:dihydropyrimidinase [Mesorhizobium sp. BAC0120]|uniref:dihydropyrimidinase n=1 Tax=Mesorhizobium sp. BAC0120 TaxID=3090670 RepID=UPI00298CC1DF|nr:dihydropyrimidinase [Mesorhizobium sp. BAC0120]MDW6023182.1 dihydropyrimidinase [Mesorhizobium sp. BAC0120]